MKVKVKAPGSCGELVQGVLDGQNFLITCPVNLYAEVEIVCPGNAVTSGSKLEAAVKQTLEYLRLSGDFRVIAKSELPIGKGMASSSADISACAQAVALKLGKKLTIDEIADIALAIEPTDGIFYPGIVLFDHITGRIRKSLGQPPSMKILIFDSGGKVDTVAFNKRCDLIALNKHKEAKVRQAVELVTIGLNKQDPRLIGEGATLSAFANQAILYKQCLEKVYEIAKGKGSVGVNVAHSGTVLGVLYTPDKEHLFAACIEEIVKACPELEFICCTDLVGGGLWKQEGDENEWKNCI